MVTSSLIKSIIMNKKNINYMLMNLYFVGVVVSSDLLGSLIMVVGLIYYTYKYIFKD